MRRSSGPAIFSAAIDGRIPGANLLLEPERRETAVAIASGAALFWDGLLALMPADHYV
jgi:mannose-1-phosphate guanylyltransferase